MRRARALLDPGSDPAAEPENAPAAGLEAKMREAAEHVIGDHPNVFNDAHMMAIFVCQLLDQRDSERPAGGGGP